MWIGIDDTDGPSGGCTTFVLTEVLRAARNHGLDLIGAPRLVRLNPNVPWKTRGNAALSARLGVGEGPARSVGRLPEGPLRAFRVGTAPSEARLDRFLTEAWDRVLSASDPGPRSDPAMVALATPPSRELYYQAVRSVVTIRTARSAISEGGGRAWVRGSSRGLVGATAAIAWPGRVHTWELIGYRERERWSLPREVDAESVRATARRFPSLFQCYDARTRRLLVTPHTNCPVLLGLRARTPGALPRALQRIRSEPRERWLLFRTNQGTGDHLVDRTVSELLPYHSARIGGTVSSAPEPLPGGHVRFRLSDRQGDTIECWAFEPTKSLPQVARSLAIGDRLRLWGGRGQDAAFRLEGIEILAAPPRTGHRHPPRCPACDRAAGSLGTGRGYRCPTCRRRFPPESARGTVRPAAFGRGVYHPTPSARRHLHPIDALRPARRATPI